MNPFLKIYTIYLLIFLTLDVTMGIAYNAHYSIIDFDNNEETIHQKNLAHEQGYTKSYSREVEAGYNDATVILRGWKFEKVDPDQMYLRDLSFAITDIKYNKQKGVVTWKLKMVTLNERDPDDPIEFSYDYSIILLEEGVALEYSLGEKKARTGKDEISTQWSQSGLPKGYKNASIFISGYAFHLIVSNNNYHSDIRQLSFSLGKMDYNPTSGSADWTINSSFKNAENGRVNDDISSYLINYGYTIILFNEGKSFSAGSPIIESNETGKFTGMYARNAEYQHALGLSSWSMEYKKEHHSVNRYIRLIGAGIGNITLNRWGLVWSYTSSFRGNPVFPYRWKIGINGISFKGKRVDGHYSTGKTQRFGIDRHFKTTYNGVFSEQGRVRGTNVPFLYSINNNRKSNGGFSYDGYPIKATEAGPGKIYNYYKDRRSSEENLLKITKSKVYDNSETPDGIFNGLFSGGLFANWYLWAFPAKGFDNSYIKAGDSARAFQKKLFQFVPHVRNKLAASTLLDGPFHSPSFNEEETGFPEWGEEEILSTQELKYQNFPIWDWSKSNDDRLIIFLWESDEGYGDDRIALFLIEKGEPDETFTLSDNDFSGSTLEHYKGLHLELTLSNARSPGDLFVDKKYSGDVSTGTFINPFKKVSEALEVTNKMTGKQIITIESGVYNERLHINQPVILRPYGGKIIIGKD